MANNKVWMYLSLWREHGGAPGLGLFSVNTETGEITFHSKQEDKVSFNCSCVDKKRMMLYVCNEDEKVRGIPYSTGQLYGYKISPEDGSLTEVFHQVTHCPNPVYVSLDGTGKYLILAHHSIDGGLASLVKNEAGEYVPQVTYSEAVIQLYSLKEDGSLGELLDVKKHTVENSVPPKGTHPHSAVVSPSGNLVAVCDKGDGHVYLYAIDREHNELKLLSRTMTDVPGASPRYCVFHPTQPYFAVNHERITDHHMMVCSFRYTEDGAVEKVSAVDVLPTDFILPEDNHYEQQGLCISTDGEYVYTCINGPNAVGVLKLDGTTGELQLLQRAPIVGEWPRGLALVPGGKFVIVSCLVSGDVISYAVEADGRLHPTGFTAKQQGGSYMSFVSC